MRSGHIAFFVESDHSELNSSLGIADALVRAGYRVSYVTSAYFAQRILAHGAEALIYQPLDENTYPTLSRFRHSDPIDGYRSYAEAKSAFAEFVQAETGHALPQLRNVYRDDRPDLIIYDWRCLSGRLLADEWGIPRIEHVVTTVGGYDKDILGHTYDDNVLLVSIPRFFQRNPESLDSRFHFVGPLYSDMRLKVSWKPRIREKPMILVSGTTQEPPSRDLFKLAISAFAGTNFFVVLSIGDRIDPVSLGVLPDNCEINQTSSTLDMLSSASLFLGHGGQQSTSEALYRGVPLLLVPYGAGYEDLAQRVVELQLGVCLRPPNISVKDILAATTFLLSDTETQNRVKEAQRTMEANNNPRGVIQLIQNRWPDLGYSTRS